MVAATANTANSKASMPEPMEAYRRSDIRKIQVRAALGAVALLIGTNALMNMTATENKAPERIAYNNGLKCAAEAAEKAFAARSFSKDQIARILYQADMEKCGYTSMQGPK